MTTGRSIKILKTCTLGRAGDVINAHRVTGITENYLRRYLAQGVLEYVGELADPPAHEHFEGLTIEVRVENEPTEVLAVAKTRKRTRGDSTKDIKEE